MSRKEILKYKFLKNGIHIYGEIFIDEESHKADLILPLHSVGSVVFSEKNNQTCLYETGLAPVSDRYYFPGKQFFQDYKQLLSGEFSEELFSSKKHNPE